MRYRNLVCTQVRVRVQYCTLEKGKINQIPHNKGERMEGEQKSFLSVGWRVDNKMGRQPENRTLRRVRDRIRAWVQLGRAMDDRLESGESIIRRRDLPPSADPHSTQAISRNIKHRTIENRTPPTTDIINR
jgi:hypothetical protein